MAKANSIMQFWDTNISSKPNKLILRIIFHKKVKNKNNICNWGYKLNPAGTKKSYVRVDRISNQSYISE